MKLLVPIAVLLAAACGPAVKPIPGPTQSTQQVDWYNYFVETPTDARNSLSFGSGNVWGVPDSASAVYAKLEACAEPGGSEFYASFGNSVDLGLVVGPVEGADSACPTYSEVEGLVYLPDPDSRGNRIVYLRPFAAQAAYVSGHVRIAVTGYSE